MKRSLFSLLLVLVLLVAVSAFAVEATAFDCPLCEDEAFAEWDGVTGTGHWLVSADLSLAADVNVSDLHLYIAEGVALNTNGFTLKLENLEEGATESKLAIMGSGTISTTSAVSPITYTAQKGSVYLMGATIDVSGATARAAELVNTSNSFEIKANGKIIGVSASPSSSYEGGSIKVTAGTLTLTQGTITGGHAKYGGNVYVGAGGTFNMDGGTVSHGVVTYHGGNVYMVSTNSSAKAKLIMDGGTIEAGQAAKNGGNICLSTFITFTMNGGTITGNDSDGDNHGYANTQGLNIAILKGGSTSYSGCNVSLNGGTIAGNFIKNGGGVWFYINASGVSSSTRAQVNLGNVTFQNDDAEGTYTDILAGNYGRVVVQNEFNKDVYIGASSPTTNEGDANSSRIAKRAILTHEGSYVDGGTVRLQNTGTGSNFNLVGWVYNADGTQNLNMASSSASIFDGEKIVTPFETLANALAATLADGQYLRLHKDDMSFSLAQVTRVDFNGHNTTVTGGTGNLIGMDSAANGYTADGLAKVTFTEVPTLNNVVDLTINGKSGQRKYLALANEDGTYSFHRYYISMDKAGLRTDSNDGAKGPGISYSAVFRGDEAVVNAIDSYGVAFTVQNHETKYAYTEDLKATERNEGKLLAVHGMMNADYGELNISGQAYIVVDGETIYSTEAATNNLKTLVETYAAQYSANALPAVYQTSVGAMLKKYSKTMIGLGWNVPEVA